ncbi:flagellar filament capping protein FliD [Acutalibacter sp. 1XD8-36]|uniref:flagellar filament capping protein FliD n=1 Tax=Acutalibacter sp. 1XD8-36 TaxID=2320852 RepID=UPI001412F45A|nr:flagellar filament capping protein FliD [Acutalibacter sp. 1XD8-36]NBJ90294.1 hypothetical protein [Acutalibacter sp. 1XD8-36]
MASITSLMNSSSGTNSLYGNRNVISGLASGMDTESMIENSISGYKSKITSLQQKMTKMQWKQDAYRSLIVQMNNILDKYTSYSSSTNLFSSSFFTKAVNTIANGANAAAVSAIGKSSSNVAINRIKQLAQAASYTVGTDHLVSEGSETEAIDWDEKIETSNVSGSISLKYGGGKDGKGSTFTLRFSEDEVYKTPQELADAINKKLKDSNITTSSGAVSADKYIEARVGEDGRIQLVDKKGNYFAVTGSTGKMGELFKKSEAAGSIIASEKPITEDDLIVKNDRASYLGDKYINVTLDGKTKKIQLKDIVESDAFKNANSDEDKTKALAEGINKQLKEEFGGKVTASVDATTGGLKFTGPSGNGSTLKVSGSSDVVNKALGLGEGGFSNTLQTSWTLEKALGENFNWQTKKDDDGNDIKYSTIKINGKEFEFKSTDTIKNLMDKVNGDDEAGVEIKYSSLTGNFAITAKETGSQSRVDIRGDLGAKLFGAPPKEITETTTFNDVYGGKIAPGDKQWTTFKFRLGNTNYTQSFNIADNQTMEDVIKELNKNANPGQSFSFNKDTSQFEVTNSSGEKASIRVLTPESVEIEVDKAYSESKGKFTAGQDAILSVNINGEDMELTRSSNTVDLDGMQVTLKNTFGYKEDGSIDTSAEKITFTNTSDSDKIVDAVKSFIEDYNKLVTEMHNAYKTETLKNSSGKPYEPLTDDDMSGMSESSIEAYEKKAKTGILFGDQDISNLYSKLTEAVQGSGEVGAALRSIGLTVDFSNGLSTLSLDEDKLRNMLETDPDRVKNAFTQSTANGASQDGLMAGLKTTLEMYGKTSIGSPGILVSKAGTELSSYSLSHNEIQDQMDNLQEQIERWQDKMGDRVDFYTNKFTQLEMLINQMNSQSSMLAGMMGG